MSDFFDLLFHPLSNAIMTVLTGLSGVYWIFTFIGGDWFGDTDVDVDGDLDTHGADLDTDIDADPSIFQKALEFINVGRMPFMVVLFTFKFIAWIFTLVSSIVLGLASWGWKSVLILLPVFVVAFVLTRFATKPLVKIYGMMGYNGEESHDLVGRIARMQSTIEGNTIGGAELQVKSDRMRILVKSKTGERLAYNAEVMIADESPDKKYYLVVPEINLNNIV